MPDVSAPDPVAGATEQPRVEARVTLVGKPGCHLCDEAEVVVREVCAELGVAWELRSITEDPALADAYWELVPVLLVDGVRRDYYRIDPARLRAALTPSTHSPSR